MSGIQREGLSVAKKKEKKERNQLLRVFSSASGIRSDNLGPLIPAVALQ